MPFVQRDQSGKVVGLFNEPQPELAEEFLTDDNAEIVAFHVPHISLHDRLKTILTVLPDTVQAQFGEVAAAIDLAVRNGKPDVATLELQALTLTSDLEPVRTQMLQEINNGL